VFAQVLPLAATLQGLELLHASAVELAGRTLAFVAASGTGKTSLAAQLVAGGASLLTDDVLALEGTPAGVVGHPGAPVFAVARGELAALSPAGRLRLGPELARADKVLLAPDLLAGPRRLDAIFFLARSRSAARLAVAPLSPTPARLLGSSFNAYVGSEQRVVNQLDVYAQLARSVPMYEVVIAPSSPAPAVARAVRAVAEREL
jgi:hypothetical protein